MSTAFTDLNKAINHAVAHAGLSSIIRNEKTYYLDASRPMQTYITLLTEVGITPEAQSIYEPLHIGNEISNQKIWNQLQVYGNATGQSPVKPGMLFKGVGSGQKETTGLVLEVNAQGEITKYLTHADAYPQPLTIVEGLISLSHIYMSFELGAQPRMIDAQNPYHGFYGDGAPLLALTNEINISNSSPDFVWDIWSFPMSRNNNFDLIKHICGLAPFWVKLRLMNVDSHDELRYTINTLGKGIQPFTAESKLSYGTLLFSKLGCGVLVNNKSDGRPYQMIASAPNNYCHVLTYINPDDMVGYWEPSTEPFAYLPSNDSEGYADINQLTGHLLTLSSWRYRDCSVPLFKGFHLTELSSMKPELVALLKSGPDDRNDWPAFLSGYGKGLQPASTPLTAGDFLIIDENKDSKLAVNINGKVMLTVDSYNKLIWQPITNVSYVWKPTTKPR
jgi:hypothetical protein